MRTLVATVLAFVFTAAPGWAQRQSASGYWRGTLEVHQFNFSYAVGVRDKNLVTRGVDQWESDYDLYQSAAGVAREELTHLNRNRSVEPPMDIRILDYRSDSGLVFDRGGEQAIKGPLTPAAPGRNIGSRRILGVQCRGMEYEWETPQGATVKLDKWSGLDTSFKVPLLEVAYFTDSSGALLSLTLRMVTKLETVDSLPDSLFQPPPGLEVTNVPLIE
jgi:hypothetical protein